MAMPPAVEISKKRKDPLFQRRVENSPGFRTKNGSEDIVTLWFMICLLSWMKKNKKNNILPETSKHPWKYVGPQKEISSSNHCFLGANC